MSYNTSDVFRNGDTNGVKFSFVGTMQYYGDKTATTLKTNAIFAYLFHALLCFFSKVFPGNLIDQGHTPVGLLPF